MAGSTDTSTSNVAQLGRSVYTTYLFPFEVTAALLVIAVVGAVVLARRPPGVGEPGGDAGGGDHRGRDRQDASVSDRAVEEAYAASEPAEPTDEAPGEASSVNRHQRGDPR